MRALIVEDDATSRRLLALLLDPYGEHDVAVDGEEAIEAVRRALDEGRPYDLICLDIMMPKMDGHEALRRIRVLEGQRDIPVGESVKVIVTTALGDARNVFRAFSEQCEGYLVKPVEKDKLDALLKKVGVI